MSHEGDALRAQLNALHESLLTTGGGAVRDQLAACLLPKVSMAVRARLPRASAEILSDAVSDAVLRYCRKPSIYLPSRSRLDTFLAIVATRLAIDALRKELRRHAIEVGLDLARAHASDTDACPVGPMSLDLSVLCRTSEERLFLEARLDGERAVAQLALLLGGAELPAEEQRRLVKRTTERLRMRARRTLKALSW
jgi:DNA-directed RNA polymerase specialized sigma24 family protein